LVTVRHYKHKDNERDFTVLIFTDENGNEVNIYFRGEKPHMIANRLVSAFENMEIIEVKE